MYLHAISLIISKYIVMALKFASNMV